MLRSSERRPNQGNIASVRSRSISHWRELTARWRRLPAPESSCRSGSTGASTPPIVGVDRRATPATICAPGDPFPNAAIFSDSRAVHRDLPLNFFMERYTQSYLAEMAAFVDAIADDAPVPVSGQDGRTAVVLSLAAQRSHRENQPIRIAR